MRCSGFVRCTLAQGARVAGERCVKGKEALEVYGGRFFRQSGLSIIKQSRKELSGARPPSRYPSLRVQEKPFLLPMIGLNASPDRNALFEMLLRIYRPPKDVLQQ